jgi:ATP-dependent helicase/nuclease subunit A
LQIGREKYSDEPVVFLVSNDPENQSEMIANYILSLINSGKKIFDRKEERSRKIEFGDFALLFRKRKEIKEYENIFNEKKIPFVVSGGRGFYQSEEIQDWISYLNFLANPHNDLFLLAILRSPFFALSDNQILKISFQEGKSFFEKLKNYTAANPDDYSLKEILNILNSHLKIASRYSIPELLQTILKDTLYYGKIDYASKKSQMIANVEKLIGVAHKYESVGLQDLKSFSAYLKEAFETEDNIESEATISEIKGSVQMMTIHQAKGLEFPIVILPNLHQKFNQSSIKFGDIGINDYFGFVFKLTDGAGNNYHTYSSFFGNMMNEAIDYNEELRLLYVALTRATEKLVISFAHNDEETKQTKEDSFKQIILNSFDEVKLTPLEKNPFKINSQLTFQKVENENIVEETKDYTLKIEVLQNLSSTDSTQSLVNQPTSKSPELNLKIFAEGIESKVREEIFTATQLNVYNFCPAKYLLKFVIGFNPDKNYFSENLDDDFVGGLEFGRVFHKLMERLTKPDLDEISKTIDEILKSQPESLKSNLKSEVLQKCSKLTDNKNFLEIFSAKKSYREFEMKIKFENHILLGIVDRINIDENGITIIDYKTDSFKLEDYDRKVNEYKTQMEFYVLLVSEFFKRNDDINLVLFFINYPDKPFKTKFTSNQIDSIKKHFSQILSNIENGIFQKNLTNCSICEFALRNDQCILKWDGSPLKN